MSQVLPSDNPLATLRLERAGERRHDDAWLLQQWRVARVLVLDCHGDVRADADGRLAVLDGAGLDPACRERTCFLGLADGGIPWFALPLAEGEACPTAPDGRWLGLRQAAAAWPAFDSGLFAYARALALWHQRSRHCGCCGAPTRIERAGHAVRCTRAACALEHFPRLDPAIIVLVTDGERCLLGRQPGWPQGQYSTLAGFVEPGESLEDAVRREVAEEAGVVVGGCRYQSSQPWPFPSSLMIGFHADAIDPAIRLGDELEDARWFHVDALRAQLAAGELRASSRISVAFRLLHDWVAQLRGADAAAALARRD